MSSSFGGNQGTIRYRIEVDQGNLPQSLSTVNQNLQKTNTTMQNTGKSIGGLNTNFRMLGGSLPITPLGQFQTAGASVLTTIDKTGSAADKTSGKLASFGEKFRGNKGLVFGAAGLSSALAEAVGMLDMFAMASEQSAEATDKVNQLTEQGITTGKEYNQAINEQTKAEKFLNMARRNTMLSMMDNVFFGTMVISQLTSMNMRAGILGKTFDKLKGIFRSNKMEGMAFSGALGNMGVGFEKAGKGAQFLGMSLKSIGIIAGISAAIGLAVMAIEHFTQKAEASSGPLGEFTGSIMSMSEELKEVAESAKTAVKDFGLVPEVAAASKEVADLSAALGKLKLQRQEMLKPVFRGRATTKPGDTSDIDKQISSTQRKLDQAYENLDKLNQQSVTSFEQLLGENMQNMQNYLDKKTQMEGQNLQNALDYLDKQTQAEGQNLQNSLDYLNKKTQMEGQNLQNSLDYLDAKTQAEGQNLQNSLDYLDQQTQREGENLQNSLDYLDAKTQAEGENLQNSLDYLEAKTQAEGEAMQKSLDYLETIKKRNQEIQQDLLSKVKEGQEAIAQALDIKLKDKDKVIRKIMDYLPDNIRKQIKADLKFDLNLDTTREHIMNTLYAALGTEELDDKEMDEVVKRMMKVLAEKFPNAPGADKMRQELAATIAGDDTAAKVAALMAKWEAQPIPVQISPESLTQLSIAIQKAINGETYVAPVTAEVESIDIAWQDVGNDVMSKLDTRGDRFNHSTGGNELTIPVSKATLVPKTIQIMDNGGKEGSGHPGSWGGAYATYIGAPPTVPLPEVIVIPETISFGEMTKTAVGDFQIIAKAWDQVVVAKIADGASALASHWSSVMNSFMKNASAAGNGVYKNLHKGNQRVADNSDDLAKHWSKVMNSFINNAEAAADGVNKALGKIKDVDVKIRVGITGAGASRFEQFN